MMINASNPADWIPSDGGTYDILATHYVVMPGTYIDRKTSEVVDCADTIFIDREGKHVRFQSEWAPRKLHAMMALIKPEQWKKGVRIQCYCGSSRQGGQPFGTFKITTYVSE